MSKAWKTVQTIVNWTWPPLLIGVALTNCGRSVTTQDVEGVAHGAMCLAAMALLLGHLSDKRIDLLRRDVDKLRASQTSEDKS